MITIQLIQIGHNDLINLKDFVYSRNNSSVFRFDTKILENLNADFLNKPELTIHNTELETVSISDITSFNIGIVNRPLDGNWFSQPINDRFIVVSTFDFDSLEIHEGISIENYLLRFAYAFSIIYSAYNGFRPDSAALMQDNITGCLFDRAIYKKQIATFFNNPHISIAAKNILESKTLDRQLIPNVESEVKGLKISCYYRYADWMKRHPIIATIIIFLGAFVLYEIGGNFIYDLIMGQICKISKSIQQFETTPLWGQVGVMQITRGLMKW